MIGPWQLLALRENETAMDVSSAVVCMLIMHLVVHSNVHFKQYSNLVVSNIFVQVSNFCVMLLFT